MRYGLLLLTICISYCTQAQSVFRDLTAVQFGDSILLNWTLTGGNTCFDMHLQRSENGNAFLPVYSIGGVCGGTDDQYYDFIDSEQLISGTEYAYKVTASNDTYTSDTVTITYVNAGDADIFLYPNPSSESVQVTIDNRHAPSFLIEIFDSNGKQIEMSQRTTNLFSLPTAQYDPGVYVLKITTHDGIFFSTSLIVL